MSCIYRIYIIKTSQFFPYKVEFSMSEDFLKLLYLFTCKTFICTTLYHLFRNLSKIWLVSVLGWWYHPADHQASFSAKWACFLALFCIFLSWSFSSRTFLQKNYINISGILIKFKWYPFWDGGSILLTTRPLFVENLLFLFLFMLF